MPANGPLHAAVDPDDRFYLPSRRALKRLADPQARLVVASPMLSESYSLVLHRLGKEVAQRFGREIEAGTALLDPAREDYLVALARIRTLPDQSITLFDGPLAVLSSRLGYPVWTYDRHFRDLGVEVWQEGR